MTAMLSFAHDFEAGGIYYNITSSSAPYMVEVTYKGTYSTQYSNEYSDAVSIPSSVIIMASPTKLRASAVLLSIVAPA